MTSNSNSKIMGGRCRCITLLMLTAMLALTGCATHANQQNIALSKVDPYERINRKIFVFNDRVDAYVAEPIADAYKCITPQFVQTGVFNFYNNLKNINTVFNDVLQGKMIQSAKDTGRLAVNSTLGLLGVVDVAKRLGLEQNDEDFEQTLAVWGVPKGPYLVLPLLGPSTTRGIPGAIFDTAANPSSYVGAPVQLLSLLNARANAEGALKFIDEAALDPYVFTRESFLQWRHSLATDGKSQIPLDFEDEMEADDEDNVASGPAALRIGLKSYTQQFEQASLTFSNIARSFDETAASFESAGHKIQALKK